MIKRYRYVLYMCIVLTILGGCMNKNEKQVSSENTQVSEDADMEEKEIVQEEDVNEAIRIRISFEDKEIIAVLQDNPTTQSLLSQLPIHVAIEDFVGKEKIMNLPVRLASSHFSGGSDPSIGDVACYGPWGNLVLYYEDQPYATGIIPMGKIETGFEEIASIQDGVQVYIERL